MEDDDEIGGLIKSVSVYSLNLYYAGIDKRHCLHYSIHSDAVFMPGVPTECAIFM